MKERLPVSSLTGGRRRVMTEAERVERLDCNSSLFASYEGLLCCRAVYVREISL